MTAKARPTYGDDEMLRNALALARRLPPSGRKPSEYLLASAVLELNERLKEARPPSEDEPDHEYERGQRDLSASGERLVLGEVRHGSEVANERESA